MHTKSELAPRRIRAGTVGPLSVVIVALFLLACSERADDGSDDDRGETPADAAAQVEREAPARPPSGTAANVDTAAPVRPDTASSTAPTLAEVLEQHADSLRTIRGVVGVDSVACNGDWCIQVTVTRRTQSIVSQLPADIEGYAVVVVERRGGH